MMERLGNVLYHFEDGKIWSLVPFPLLKVHLGNDTPLYYIQNFNLMYYFEFTSDTYASLHNEQYFKGLLLNSLPFIKKLKWRLVGTSNVLFGHLSKESWALIPPLNLKGIPHEPFHTKIKRLTWKLATP